jgi:hypothetical protein
LKAAVRNDRKQGSPIADHVASSFVGPRPRRTETFSELRQKAQEETFANLYTALGDGLPLFERLYALRDSENPEESMAYLLDSASARAERLLATLNSARNLEKLVAFGSALLETLKTFLEEPRSPRRRAHASDVLGTDPDPDRSRPGRAA